MQGLRLPSLRPCTSSSLPHAMERSFSPPPSLVEPFQIFEPVDTCGKLMYIGSRMASDNISGVSRLQKLGGPIISRGQIFLTFAKTVHQ